MQTEKKPENIIVRKRAAGVLARGPIIGRQNIEITADMGHGSLVFELTGTGITIKLAAGDVASVLNEAVKKGMERQVKSDEKG